jgi:aminoglycoside 6-adenylyltransferase
MNDRDEMLDRIRAWAPTRPELRGALLVGSAARSVRPADEHSDLDVILFVDDPDPWVRDAGWVRAIGLPWLTFVEPTMIGHLVERRVLFDNGVDVDFSLVPPPALEPTDADLLSHVRLTLQRGAVVLHDPDGFLARAVAAADAASRAERVERPTAAEVANVVGDLLYHVVWTARKAARGELWVAAECLNAHMQGRLLTLAGWHAALVGGADDTWHGGRFIEQWADPRAVAGLRRSMATSEPASISAALRGACELTELLGGELAPRVGWTYPAAAHERVVTWLAARDGASG